MTVYLFDEALVIPGSLIDSVADALRAHVRDMDRLGGSVDGDFRAFVSALGQTLAAGGPSGRLDSSSTYVGVAEAAGRLDLSERTIRRRCHAGLIPGAHRVSGRWVIPLDHAS